ncbi:hypothetical protein EJ03DRAFT_373659 [Teratosphaeria nubilosa]|uniref:Uncharacterized protein n=1 Tax=Teratosphaeria nubilosa TaxID=161662 RepID=A0A6G1LD95_9PEZI|nr:hypothetical protein EJ03DRAFT_373659 [Teratosphaeria nubilosa]
MSERHFYGGSRLPPTPGSAGSRVGAPAQPHSIVTVQGFSPLSQTPITPELVLLSSAASTAYTGNPAQMITNARSLQPQQQAMEPYNPRQWSGRQISRSQMAFGRSGNAAAGPSSTREVTGMEEAMPTPPPPYSPDTAGSARTHPSRASAMIESLGLTASPLPVESSRHSPQISMSPAFPPPPGQPSRHRERSASGLGGPRAFLSGLRGKQTGHAEIHAPQPATFPIPQYVEPRPPAARRAASTGQIAASYSISSAPGPSERSSPDSSWRPGMPLPGPPPGPPPPGARSQSLNRYPPTTSSLRSENLTSEHGIEGQHARRAAATSNLGPVPPTPADWVDEHVTQASETAATSELDVLTVEPQYQPLRIDTGSHNNSGISRRPATRDSSASGLRERRSLSRRAKGKDLHGNEIFSPATDDIRPVDQLFSTAGEANSRRREHVRTNSSLSRPYPGYAEITTTSTQAQESAKIKTTVMTPPYTPATRPESSKRAELRGPTSASSDRPLSHLLHTPNQDSTVQVSPSPARPASTGAVRIPTKLDTFALQAMERHRLFIEKEATATSDEDRLELFATFMVHESRLRRDRYTAAYNAMAGDVVDLTRDMWRSYTTQSRRAVTPSTSMSSFDPTIPSWASDGQPASAHGAGPHSASSLTEYTPATDVSSMGDLGDSIERAESRQWVESFKPSLSPIQSVAQSTLHDEDSSRGRAPSRWWEQKSSGSGSGSIGKPDRMEKTRRETKYMGVKASQLREEVEPLPALTRHTATPGASVQSFADMANEYPPEKVGWHEDDTDFSTPMATPANLGKKVRKSSTPELEPLDVSRLVTLPPPYPRHHPAVNNSHPQLIEFRREHWKLSDHSDIQHIKDSFLNQDLALQHQQKHQEKQRRTRLRNSIQAKISDGSISFAEAAQAEKEFDGQEADRSKANARAIFDLYETQVAQPLATLLTERIESATACIGQLRSDLSWDNQSSDPNQAQEEGDEQPERLEKLTLLKWLFEAREQLHKEMFDLHAGRSEKYSEVVLAPYRIQKAQSKIDEATAFFAKDTRDRQIAFSKDGMKRLEDLQQVMEKNVSRGVEDQLSAFWDIAPNLLEVISRIPTDISTLEIQIPPQEYDENPTYHDHPMQYLHSLLEHAEESAYQFIESQTNLLCLLHEVRTATSKSQLRLQELTGEVVEGVRFEVEGRLDAELKEKVGEVESLWREALGEGIEGVRERVGEFLVGSGGWEDGMDG